MRWTATTAVHQNWSPPAVSLVGKTGFEPATPCSQSRCATKLRHFPNVDSGYRPRTAERPVTTGLNQTSIWIACVGQLSSAARHFDSMSLPGLASSNSAKPLSPTRNTSGASISQDPLPMHLSTSNMTCTFVSPSLGSPLDPIRSVPLQIPNR